LRIIYLSDIWGFRGGFPLEELKRGMKKTISSVIICAFLFSSPVSGDELDRLARETDKLWRKGAGAEDGAFTASALSMLGWGVGLAAVIALIAILVHQSSGASAHSHCE